MAKSESTAKAVMMVLAAGLATRMAGRVKPDLPWVDGRTLLEHQQAIAQQAGFETLLVTRVGSPSPGQVINDNPQRGLASSLRCGLAAVRARWGAIDIGVLLADQPFIAVADINVVYQAFYMRGPGIHAARARYGGIPGHPVFFDRTWDRVVNALQGDVGLGHVWGQRRDGQWVDVEVIDRPSPSFDIDTDEAYQQALKWAR